MQDKTRWKASVYSWFWSWILRRDWLKKEDKITPFPRGETKSSSFEIFYEEATAHTNIGQCTCQIDEVDNTKFKLHLCSAPFAAIVFCQFHAHSSKQIPL